jgi:hypothetical protein
LTAIGSCIEVSTITPQYPFNDDTYGTRC